MVSSKPNSIKNIYHTRLNHQLTLWRPVSIQELPKIIYITELNGDIDDGEKPVPQLQSKKDIQKINEKLIHMKNYKKNTLKVTELPYTIICHLLELCCALISRQAMILREGCQGTTKIWPI